MGRAGLEKSWTDLQTKYFTLSSLSFEVQTTGHISFERRRFFKVAFLGLERLERSFVALCRTGTHAGCFCCVH